MHEASLAQGLLHTAAKAVEEYNTAHPQAMVRRIAELRCELGLISCVEPKTLTACFELLAEGTVAEGARLTLDIAPLACRCTGCGHAFTLTQRHFVCPQCGDENIHFNGGHGLTLMALHVASEDTDHE
ncbi:MAG: hydrogenase maturation nickel metallochaperone HypA [Desulfovibrio desulfuricans]|jgi:hydrogenase nickel incorporation protein HypA/HybF|nr:hydrogenase maturation nickel metallochaperone HypA [Desulfovibrio desulfuricans]